MSSNINITITTSGGPAAVTAINNVGDAAAKAKPKVDLFQNALKALAFGGAVRELAELADKYTLLTNKLKAAGDTGTLTAAVFDKLQKSANESRSGIETTVQLYSRLRLSSKNLGASQQKLIDVTDTLTKASAVSGATTEESAGALLQLSQAFASGRLNGDELRSVLENLPIVADAIADHMGVTRGELRALGKQGQVTGKIMLEALQEAREEIVEKFGTAIPTIGQSLTVLQNAAIAFGERLQPAAIAASQAILLIADNFDNVARASIGLGAGVVAVLALRAAFDLLTIAATRTWVVILANPISALVAALASTIALLALYRNEIVLSAGSTATLGDLAVATQGQLSTAWEGVTLAASNMARSVTSYYQQITNASESSTKDQTSWWVKMIRGVTIVVDSFAAIILGIFNAIGVGIGATLAALQDSAVRLGEELKALVELDFTKFAELTSADAAFLKETGKQIWTDVKDGFDDAFKNQAQFGITSILDKSISEAEALARRRDTGPRVPPPDLLSPTNPARPPPDDNSKLEKALDALVKAYDQVGEARKRMADAISVLNRAETAGLIGPERHVQLLKMVAQHLKDALDPFAAYSRELDRESNLLGINSQEREIQTKLFEAEQQLRSKGLLLTQAESTALENRLRLLQEERQLSEAKDKVREAVEGPRRDFQTQTTAVSQLRNSGNISGGEANKFIVDQNAELLKGTLEAQNAMVAAWRETYDKIGALREASLIGEGTANQLRAAADKKLAEDQGEASRLKADAEEKELEKRLSSVGDFFNNLSSLSRIKNREIALIGRAAAVATATIDGYVAIQKAYAAAPPPFNIPFAVAAGVATAANIANILATPLPGYAFGGDFTVGGTGGTDSQTVAFRATPGETVRVQTPSQAREEGRQGDGAGSSTSGRGLRIINVLDPGLLGNYLSSSEGEQVIINTLRRNGDSVRRIVADS